jgi:hypothetical protein
MSNLLDDLRKLDLESYQGYDRGILKYALSLLEIIANDRRTRMTPEEFWQIPGKHEYVDSFLSVGHWSYYAELNERERASIREWVAARLQEFVRAREVGTVAVEGDAILVRGEADSGLLVVLVDGGYERIDKYLAQGARIWDLWKFHQQACIYGSAKERAVLTEGSLEDPAILPGFKLPLSEVFPRRGERG